MTARESPAPGEWRRIGPTTSVMEMPGGCVLRVIERTDLVQINGAGDVRYLEPAMMSTCFIPYPPQSYAVRIGAESGEAAMERWIRQAVERQKGEK